MAKTVKTKHQSKIDYLDSLQKEFFINLIKSKIYPKHNDRKYYKRVMEHKKDKILNLSFNMGGVSNIFDNEEDYERYKYLMFPKDNLPNFDLTEDEIEYYYAIDSEIKVNVDGVYKVGVMISKNIEKNICTVKLRGDSSEKIVSLNFVSRIL